MINIPSHFNLDLVDDKQREVASLLLDSLDTLSTDSLPIENISTKKITAFIDGRGLSCPQPLLKVKMALRNIKAQEGLYLVATDPNAQYDIEAYVNQSNSSTYNSNSPHSNLSLLVGQSLYADKEIWHFFLVKSH